MKPSEVTPATSALMTELIDQYLDKDLVRMVNGAIPETTKVRRRFALAFNRSCIYLDS